MLPSKTSSSLGLLFSRLLKTGLSFKKVNTLHDKYRKSKYNFLKEVVNWDKSKFSSSILKVFHNIILNSLSLNVMRRSRNATTNTLSSSCSQRYQEEPRYGLYICLNSLNLYKSVTNQILI